MIVKRSARKPTYRLLKESLYTFIRREKDCNINMQGYAEYFQLCGEFAANHESRHKGEFDPRYALANWLLLCAEYIRTEKYGMAFTRAIAAHDACKHWVAYDPYTKVIGDMS